MANSYAIQDHLPLSARDFHILLALADGDLHGYGLVKAIERASDGLLRLDPANLYRAIQKLATAGLVQDAERKPATELGDERRRYYRITSIGRRVAAAEAERMGRLAEQARSRDLLSGPSGP